MTKIELRKEYNYSESDFIILYIAEFIKRKNHGFLIRAVPELKKQIPNLKLILPGRGILLEEMKTLAQELGIDDIIDFPGYRNDINNLCRISDIHVAVSHQEGQGINNIEAMTTGLPLVVSNIRGHQDVVVDGRNGFLFEPGNSKDMIDKIMKLYNNEALMNEIKQNNIQDCKKFSVEKAIEKTAAIYISVLSPPPPFRQINSSLYYAVSYQEAA